MSSLVHTPFTRHGSHQPDAASALPSQESALDDQVPEPAAPARVPAERAARPVSPHGVVGRHLDELGPGWVVLLDAAVEGVDHVVVGPAGVFTVHDRTHRGSRVWAGADTIVVNGVHQPYVADARLVAGRAALQLTAAAGVPVAVTGLVALVCDERYAHRQPEDGAVVVGSPRELTEHLRSLPRVLDAGTVERLAAAVRRSSTWAT